VKADRAIGYPEQHQSNRLVFISTQPNTAILAIDSRSTSEKRLTGRFYLLLFLQFHNCSDKLIDAHSLPAPEYPFNSQRLDLRIFSGISATGCVFQICRLMRWTFDRTLYCEQLQKADFQLDGGRSEGAIGRSARPNSTGVTVHSEQEII